MHRFAALVCIAAVLLPATATADPGRVATGTANGVTATGIDIWDFYESCDGSGSCVVTQPSIAWPLPASKPALPVTPGSTVDLVYDKPIEVSGAATYDRAQTPSRSGSATVERISATQYRVVIGDAPLPADGGLTVGYAWQESGERARGSHHFALTGPLAVFGVSSRGKVDYEARSSGLLGARLRAGSKTLGATTVSVDGPGRTTATVPLSSGARKLIRRKRRVKALLSVTLTPPTGAPVRSERSVTLK